MCALENNRHVASMRIAWIIAAGKIRRSLACVRDRCTFWGTTGLVISLFLVAEHFQGTLVECRTHLTRGTYFWTAGQRIDPCSESSFVWRLPYDRVSAMTYTNWSAGQPDYYLQAESCMHLWFGPSYPWNDAACNLTRCSLCELDL